MAAGFIWKVILVRLLKCSAFLIYSELVLRNGDSFIRILIKGFLNALDYIK